MDEVVPETWTATLNPYQLERFQQRLGELLIEEHNKVVINGMAAYLRVCRCGGMTSKQSDMVQGCVDQALDLGYFNIEPAEIQDDE